MADADALRMLASLIAIVALILALAWAARRFTGLRGNAGQAMRLLGTQHLGGNGRAHLALVQVEDARLVLGVTATQVTLLHTLPATPQGAVSGATPALSPSMQQAVMQQAMAASGLAADAVTSASAHAQGQPATASPDAAPAAAPASFGQVLRNTLGRRP